MAEEYELISYPETNFKFSMVSVLYRTPHIHKEMEAVLILDGRVRVRSRKQEVTVSPGELYIVNPYQSHEILSDIPGVPALAVEIQLPPAFFHSYYPEMGNVKFAFSKYNDTNTARFSEILDKLTETALIWFEGKPFYKLLCAGRMNRILHYIEANYSRKLLLSELADREGLSLNYLSHFFKNFLDMSFQEYLLRIRCEKAQQLLLTDLSLLEISVTCGFSDTKYFNRGFARIYRCTPKQYRKDMKKTDPKARTRFSLTKQSFLAQEESGGRSPPAAAFDHEFFFIQHLIMYSQSIPS